MHPLVVSVDSVGDCWQCYHHPWEGYEEYGVVRVTNEGKRNSGASWSGLRDLSVTLATNRPCVFHPNPTLVKPRRNGLPRRSMSSISLAISESNYPPEFHHTAPFPQPGALPICIVSRSGPSVSLHCDKIERVLWWYPLRVEDFQPTLASASQLTAHV
jgi:hypothetical protein